MHNLIKYMSQVKDFRTGFNLQHKLVDILTIAVLAVLSGVETWDDMELYGKERHSLLKSFSNYPPASPLMIPSTEYFLYLPPNLWKQPYRNGFLPLLLLFLLIS